VIKTENCQVNRLWAEWVFDGTSYPAHVTLFETAVAAPPPMMEEGSASSLPEGDLSVLGCNSEKHIYKLVKTDKEIKIERSSRTKQG